MTEPLYRKAWEGKTPDEVHQTKQIQKLNDRLRTLLPRQQDMVICTGALADEAPEIQRVVYAAAKQFGAFTESNDPHGEHDCASFTAPVGDDGAIFMFKIDYYDLDLRFGSEKPWDQDVTRRVMTLMYAKDY